MTMTKLNHASKSNPCPLCDNTNWCYELNDDLWCCKRSDIAPPGWRRTKKQDRDGAWLFAVINGDDRDWEAKQSEREARRLERDANQREVRDREFAESLTAQQRDPLIRALSRELGLTGEHRQILRGRGLTDSQIADRLFFSIASWQPIGNNYPLNLPGVAQTEKGTRYVSGTKNENTGNYVGGIAIVTIDSNGLATGWQLMSVPRIEDKKYVWARGMCSSQLPIGDGELPIQVIGKPTSGVVYAGEGTLKPVIAAHRHSMPFIGASSGNFRGSPIQTKCALEEVKTVVITVDGGDCVNPHRVGHWKQEAEFFEGLGIAVKFVWWGQETKSGRDVDEIDTETLKSAKLLSPVEYFGLCIRLERKQRDRQLFKGLSTLTVPVTERRNEMELGALPMPRPGAITIVDSSVATGKTKQLMRVKTDWRRVFPDGSVYSVGYRNGLLKQQERRLEIPHIETLRVGHGFSNTSINNAREIALCFDSLLDIDLDSIPPNSLVLHDEVEAILAHAASGGTTGGRTAQLQARLTEFHYRVLSTGGAVIGLEDSITDVSVTGLKSLTDNRYPVEIISNTAQRFNWDVAIGNGKKSDFTALLIGRLLAGERIVVTTSSQRFGEMLERLAIARCPELMGKIERIDSQTISDLRDSELLSDPSAYLRKRGTRLLILSPTVESGFSIEDGNGDSPLFDRVMAYFVNLDTRSQIQLLARYRSNCPREIYALERGAEAGSLMSRDPAKMLKIHKQTANETALEQGIGRIENSPVGEVWNELAAKFAARSALSAQHLREYLGIELTDRGHNVTAANWLEIGDRDGLNIPDPQSIDDEVKTIGIQIETEKAQLKFAAKPFLDGSGKPDTKAATAKIHSSNTSNADRLRAEKTLLVDDLPGADLSFDFILEAVVKRRGAYRKECELAWFIDKPALAKILDREIFKTQLDQPHIIYGRVAKLSQRVRLLNPIADAITDLIGREYQEGDEVVTNFSDYLVQQAYEIDRLFGLKIKQATIGTNGRRQNTAIANINKLLKRLGYLADRVKRMGTGTDRIDVYRVVNADCQHRDTIYQSLETKYGAEIESTSTVFNMDSTYIKTVDVIPEPDTKPPIPISDPPIPIDKDLTETIELLRLAITYPCDYLSIVRQTIARGTLDRASRYLSAEERKILRFLVVAHNGQVSA